MLTEQEAAARLVRAVADALKAPKITRSVDDEVELLSYSLCIYCMDTSTL